MSESQPTGLLGMAAKKFPKTSLMLAVGGAAVVFFALAVFLAKPEGTVLERISDVEYARGVLTFIIAIGTVAIALILAVAAIVQTGDQAKERFSRGKEVLTALVGILGTIVGFYFGSSGNPSSDAPEPPPAVVESAAADKAEVVVEESADEDAMVDGEGKDGESLGLAGE